MTYVMDVTLLGLDRHIYEQLTVQQNDHPNTKSSDANATKNENHENIAITNNYISRLASPYQS